MPTAEPAVAFHDPFAASAALQQEYLGYLRDALPIHPTQSRLRALFDEKINRPDAFCREPLVSAIPAWKPDRTPADLIARSEAPRLHRDFATLLDADRPLYAHQVDAIAKVQQGRNVVVATGTGSGKTECFLLPLIDAALRSGEPGGVQAILIYPMNALANDQLDRLRHMLGGHGVTFGRYTGQTPRDPLPDGHEDKQHRNERSDRTAIQSHPPQLLLTNFAMLEYLLLRPDDQQIFRHGRVTTVVLDEAHSYRGAQGIDISLLMRRLRQRFGDHLKFILTSATIGDDGPGSNERIAAFASKLTGAPFDAADVIRGTSTTHFAESGRLGLTPEAAAVLDGDDAADRIAAIVTDAAETGRWIKATGLEPARSNRPAHLLFEALRRVEPLAMLQGMILAEPTTAADLSERLAAEGHALSPRAVGSLLLLAANAASPAGVPLLPARVHHFFRGLQGASVELSPPKADGSPADEPVAALSMQEDGGGDDGQTYWPLYVCYACGMPAVMAEAKTDGSFAPPPPGPTGGNALLTWMDSALWRDEAEGDRADDADPASAWPGVYELPKVKGGDLSQCPCCGARAGGFESVMRRVSTGPDAATAVLAEELLRQLPVNPADADLPAGGRKLLAFSDSRQRAAYFAPYLGRTIADASFVQPLVEAAARAEASDEPLSLTEWPNAARDLALKQPWVLFRERHDHNEDYEVKASGELNSTDRKNLSKELAVAAYEHLTASLARRNRLPALLLAYPEIDLAPARRAAFDEALGPFLADPSIRHDLIQRLLLLLVRRYALTFEPFNITRRDLISEGKGATASAVHLDPPAGGKLDVEVFRWNPLRSEKRFRKANLGRSRQAEQVRKGLLASGAAADDEAISGVLEVMWRVMTAADSGLMEDMGQGRFRLDAGHVLVRRAGPWFRCDRCDARTRVRMGGGCEVFGCPGRLAEVADPDAERGASRSVQRYSREPLPVKVLEHTAQLTFEQGSKYQKMFTDGRANVLSCSTTFEMGVDVGDLDTVFLRNVPRATSNYTQRVGRAGRRNRSLAHAVTFAQASPHDQHHYWTPSAIAAGRVPVPVVYTANPILTQRHINAFLLGRFWASQKGDTETTSRWKVADAAGTDGFFATEPEDTTCPAARFGQWVERERDALAAAVSPVVASAELEVSSTELVDDSRRQLIEGEGSVWRSFVRRWSEFGEQAGELNAQAKAAIDEGDHKRVQAFSGHAARAVRIRDELAAEDLIGFLSSRHWLPNYAFPQDTVRLLVRQDGESAKLRLERNRAMGIIEYAPGAEVIVDGRLIRSAAVDLERRTPALERFADLGEGRVELLGPDTSASGGGRSVGFLYLEPRGFSTSVDERIERPNLFRKRPTPNTPVFLIGGASDDTFAASPGLPGVTTAFLARSTLFTANYGGRRANGQPMGHPICLSCGSRVERGLRGPHQTAWGRLCKGRFEPVSLAHRFETAVLQVRFHKPEPPLVGSDEAFWKTLATAMAVAAGELLDIERDDLSVDYRSRADAGRGGELFVYDNVAGGAGYARRVQERLPEVLRATRDRLDRCDNPECRPEGSCYACLRSYGNQFHWPLLRRDAAADWCRSVCG